jgi:TolB-like protein
MLIAALAGAGIVGALYLRVPAPPQDMASGAHADVPVLTGPSLAVMPFSNVSGDPEQEYFADGITEDLITDLSKFTGLFVIARNTTFSYKGRAMKAQEVADDLGVRYVLEGGIRREGKNVRINVQLADTATETLLWAERYDGSLTEVFALQDNITRRIVAALAVELPKREESLRSRIETESPEAYDAFLVGWALYRRRTPEDLAKSVSFLDQAVALDPGFGRAHAALAAIYSEGRVRGWEQSLGLTAEACWRRAEEHLSAAKQDPTALAHQVAANMLSFQGRHEEAIAEAGRAIALDASDPAGYQALAQAQKAAGKALEGVFR